MTGRRQRLEWLDLYRGIAVLVMIETHVANTFLAAAGWPADWRARLDYVNGLVAPAFLFIAGYALGCFSLREGATRPPLRRRLLRLAGIAALGYAMHIPWAEISAGKWAEALRLGTQMDVLPCLAASLAAIVLIDRVSPPKMRSLALALVVSVVAVSSDFAEWTDGPIPLLALVNENTGSLFPLFPWSAFVFAGFGASEAGARFRGLIFAALLCGAVAVATRHPEFSRTSAAFFYERLAWILLLAPFCGWVANLHAPRFVLFAGRESLALYLAHLLLIAQLERIHPARLGALPTLAVVVAITAASFAAAWSWRAFSVARADRARREVRLPESSAPAA